MRRAILFTLVPVVLLFVSCTVLFPPATLTITNSGSFEMYVTVVSGLSESKYIPVNQSEVWEIEPWFDLGGTWSQEAHVTAKYSDASLAYGGLFEIRLWVTNNENTNLNILDCPGWY